MCKSMKVETAAISWKNTLKETQGNWGTGGRAPLLTPKLALYRRHQKSKKETHVKTHIVTLWSIVNPNHQTPVARSWFAPLCYVQLLNLLPHITTVRHLGQLQEIKHNRNSQARLPALIAPSILPTPEQSPPYFFVSSLNLFPSCYFFRANGAQKDENKSSRVSSISNPTE